MKKVRKWLIRLMMGVIGVLMVGGGMVAIATVQKGNFVAFGIATIFTILLALAFSWIQNYRESRSPKPPELPQSEE